MRRLGGIAGAAVFRMRLLVAGRVCGRIDGVFFVGAVHVSKLHEGNGFDCDRPAPNGQVFSIA